LVKYSKQSYKKQALTMCYYIPFNVEKELLSV